MSPIAIVTGIQLVRKRRKCAAERAATQSFISAAIVSVVLALGLGLGALYLGGILADADPSYKGEYDHAHTMLASGGLGLWSDGEIHSIDLSDYALDDLAEGDALNVYVSSTEEVLGADSPSDPDHVGIVCWTALSTLAFLVILGVYIGIVAPLLGRDFLAWWTGASMEEAGRRTDKSDVITIPRGEAIISPDEIGIPDEIERMAHGGQDILQDEIETLLPDAEQAGGPGTHHK